MYCAVGYSRYMHSRLFIPFYHSLATVTLPCLHVRRGFILLRSIVNHSRGEERMFQMGVEGGRQLAISNDEWEINLTITEFVLESIYCRELFIPQDTGNELRPKVENRRSIYLCITYILGNLFI